MQSFHSSIQKTGTSCGKYGYMIKYNGFLKGSVRTGKEVVTDNGGVLYLQTKHKKT